MSAVDNIVIVGGGSAGWMSAATLITAFPEKNITVIEPEDIPIIGVGESTLGHIKNWTRFIGLDEKEFFAFTDASYKMSIKFTDFYKKDAGSFQYPFGFPESLPEKNPFLDWHLKKYYYPNTSVNDFVHCLFPSAALFENNKFSLNQNGEFGSYNKEDDVAYHFDAVKFGAWLKEKICIPRGVKHISSSVTKCKTGSSGIESLILKNKETIQAELFVDCTGFKSMLLGDALKEPFTSFSDMLPNNNAWATHLPYKDKELELEAFTNSTAIENGWCWNIPLWSRIGTGYVYSDKFISEGEALLEFKNYLQSDKMVVPRTKQEVESLEFKKIAIKTGIHERTFVKNVVAIGLSAGFVEPLESNGLFSVHEFLLKLIDILQRNDISQFDRDMYNVSVNDLFTSFAKFVALHYALSHRNDTEYWRDIKSKQFGSFAQDPYFPYQGRTDAFYNLGWRYMDEWGHPVGNSGITYIATGMNLFMMNSARIKNIEYRNQVSLKENITPLLQHWEVQKQKWQKAAESCPTLYQYLLDNFYGDNNSKISKKVKTNSVSSKFIQLGNR